MPRNPSPRGATPIAAPEVPLHRRPVVWFATVGALLMVLGLTLSGPEGEGEPHVPTDAEMAAAVAPVDPPVTPVAVSAAPEPLIPPWREFRVRNGDNLSLIFNRAGFSDTHLYRVARATDGRSLRRVYPGETVAFQADNDGELIAVRHVQSPLLTTLYTLESGGFVASDEVREPERSARNVSMTIDTSLFLAGTAAGLSDAMIMELAGIFGGVIDFVLDPRQGDTIHVLYEELMLDGQRFDDGPILAASFTNRGETFEAYRYTDLEGDTSYYNEKGVSMRKAFLRAPLDFTRVSSNFNPNRLHPIYKTQRPHRGTDYAAPTGTPVRATSDGRVTWAARNGSFGNLVVVKHEGGFETKYAHLSRYAVRKGERVRQGEVIAYVGATGGATGPHLHYEFLMNGVHQNPRTILDRLPKAVSIEPEEMGRFRSQTARLLDHFQNLNSSQLFSLNQPSAD